MGDHVVVGCHVGDRVVGDSVVVGDHVGYDVGTSYILDRPNQVKTSTIDFPNTNLNLEEW